MSKEEKRYIDIAPQENVDVLAYCYSCEKFIFGGKDSSSVERGILIKQVREHRNAYSHAHLINLIYPKRQTDFQIDADAFLWTIDNATRMSAVDGLNHKAHMRRRGLSV